MEADDVSAVNADHIVLATGSVFPETGFQKAKPHLETLPGYHLGNIASVEAVMARQVRPGKRVILLDEAGGWRGCGTAWKLAEDGHHVTLVTPNSVIGKELQRPDADFNLRRTLAKLGVTFLTEHSVSEWHGYAATLVSHLTDEKTRIEADTLVMATTPMAANWLAEEMLEKGMACAEIGDGAAPRQAPYAIYEGRKMALEF